MAAASAPVWLLTSCALAAHPTAAGASSHAGLLGLARSARAEAPASRLPLIDLDVLRPGIGRADCGVEAGRQLGLGYDGTPEPEVAFDGSSQRVPRLTEAARSLGGPIRLHFDARGAVSSLRLVPQESDESEPAHGEVRLRVGAVGLNFRDVLNVLGAYPGDPGPPGGDCAAHVAATGGGVGHLSVGDAALGHGFAALASLSRTDARLMAAIDASLSFEEASTLPTTWATVHLSLLAARPRSGDGALLHAGAGGVGLAALEYGRLLGSRIDGERGPALQARLPAPPRPRRRMLSSRDGAAFALGAARLLGARRLRLALNSLSADFIACSFALLRQDGWLCEIGKRSGVEP